MKIYLYRGQTKGLPEKREALIKESILRYAGECLGLSELERDNLKIMRSDTGKPYLEGGAIEFSESHSGDYFVCICGRTPLGIDIEILRENEDNSRELSNKYGKIAGRFFTESEALYAAISETAFLDVWVRKEAYIKLTGLGLKQGLSGFEAASYNHLYDSVDNAGKYFYKSIVISRETRCAICTTEECISDSIVIENLHEG